MERRKVTLKIFTPLLHELESQLDTLHMKRDSFLDHLIDCELSYLAHDLAGKRLSLSVRRFIARSLKQLGTSQINVQLKSDTAERLDTLARDINFVRDSFVNRILYFSFGRDSLFKFLNIRHDNSAMCHNSRSTAYFRALNEIQADPLGGLRALVNARHDVGLYLISLPVELAAFECYLDGETFWEKYKTSNEDQNITGELLQSFESTIYQDDVHEGAGIAVPR